jgi:replicative DNA helicase
MSDVITVLPKDERAERAVLSCVLQQPALAYEAPEITAEWFWAEKHRVLWRAMKTALDGERDAARFLQRVIADLEDSKQFEKLGPLQGANNAMDWVVGVIHDQSSVVGAWDIQLPRLRTVWRRRKAYEHLVRAADRVIRSTHDVDAVLDEVVKSASTIASSAAPEKENISDYTTELFEWVLAGEEALGANDGYPIAVEPMQRLNLRAVPGHYTVLAARPKQGKSRLAIRMAYELARSGVAVDFWSQEMSRWDIVKLIGTCAADLDLEAAKKPNGLNYGSHQKLAGMVGNLREIDIKIFAGPAHVRDIWFKTMARRVRLGDKPYAVFVDYIQVFDGDGKNDHERISDVTKTLAGMSRNYDCWVCALAQFNRGAAEGVPKPHQLRGSGQIEQDANELLILHRPNAEKPGVSETVERTGMIYLALNRHGNPAETGVYCDLQKLQFKSTGGMF